MRIDRRQFITGAAGSLAVAGVSTALPRRLWAAASVTLGATRIDTLSDGNLVLPGDFILGGMPQDELAAIMQRHGLADQREQITPPCNVTLMRDGTNSILFDVGSGPDFMPTAGKLAEAMDVLGISAEEITHVVFTHAHPDHLWGLLDEFDEPVFPDAVHMIGGAEWDYWTDPATVETIGVARQSFAVGAARRLSVIADTVERFGDGDEILPGVVARATHGHTPGHMAFELRDGGAGLMVVGDAIGNHHVAFDRPDWVSGSDQDGEMAAATRVRLLDRIVADDLVVIGFHLPGGGIGRVLRDGAGYRFEEDI